MSNIIHFAAKAVQHTAKRATGAPAAMLNAWRADGTLGEKVRYLRLFPAALEALARASDKKAEKEMILEELADIGCAILT